MKFEIKEYRRVAVLALAGRVDSQTSADFETTINRLMDQGHSNIILDLSEVDFLSSSGLRVMVTARNRSQDLGGEISITRASSQATESLSISGLDVLFKMHSDREEAIASY
jgi:anti-sigma B factor antagonist